MSIHYIESVSSGCGDRVTLSIRWNKARIEVDLDPSPTGNTIQDSFIEKYNAATEDGDDEEEEMISDQILDAIVQAGGDIHVLQKLLGDGYIAQVSAGGREMCCKVGDELRADALQRELSCLLTISTCQHAAALRVPKLLGLVEAADDGRTIGLLQEYVPCSDTWELSTLQNIESVSSIAKARREKWASQIQETVHLLHQIGVTWGDGKAANVLIHRDTDDVWIIDFGGGWSDGWVGQELSGTVEGDFVAVKKILEFLEV
ncbi:hypothetical protein CIB48_g9174 [Xylaria polymorpha]|nr:hypothetical protein CIB48_g9174 [Xylaria polymorpha]